MDLLQGHPWLLAVVIFLIRVLDVSMGTLRTIMVFRGFRAVSASIAFVEVLLWVLAVSQVLRNLDHWYLAVAYAGGFATGNYLGMWIDAKLALGSELLRAISASPEVRLAERLRERGFHVTELPGRSATAPVEILLVTERRRRIPELLRLIHDEDPDAVCTLSDVRHPPRAPARGRHRRIAGREPPGLTKRK